MFGKEEKQTALRDLYGLYLSHLDAIETASVSDLADQSQERHRLLQTLRREEQTGVDSRLAGDISDLIEINRALAKKAESVKQALGQELNKLARGKQALTRYGQTGYNTGAPRVLSLKK